MKFPEIIMDEELRLAALKPIKGCLISVVKPACKTLVNEKQLSCFFIICFADKFLFAQTQEATTNSGKKVILYADGTWKYAEEIKPSVPGVPAAEKSENQRKQKSQSKQKLLIFRRIAKNILKQWKKRNQRIFTSGQKYDYRCGRKQQ